MSWVALGAAAIGAAGSIYSSSQNKKAAKTAAGNVQNLDIGQIGTDTVRSNINNEQDIEALLRSSNDFQQKQNLSLLDQAVPGYSKIAGNLAGYAADASANPYALPKDFSDNLTRLAAERGINTGVRGQAGDFSLLRDFGVNELNYGNQRLNQAQSITSMLAGLGKVNPLSPLNFYTTPAQGLAAASGNQSLQASALNTQLAATTAANNNTWGAVSQFAGAAAGAYNSSRGGGATDYTQHPWDDPANQ